MCRLLMLCLSWNSFSHSRSLCRQGWSWKWFQSHSLDMSRVRKGPGKKSMEKVLFHVLENLQAALWPPSAKALRQGVGQQESGFLPCREKWRKWRKEKVLLIGSTMKTDGEDPRTLSVWPAKATCCYWVWSGWMSPWLCSYLKNMMWVPGQTVCHGETLHSQQPEAPSPLLLGRELWKDIQSRGRGWQAMPPRALLSLRPPGVRKARFLLGSQALCGIQDCSTTKGIRSGSLKWKQPSVPPERQAPANCSSVLIPRCPKRLLVAINLWLFLSYWSMWCRALAGWMTWL